jgi:hypothetical protein
MLFNWLKIQRHKGVTIETPTWIIKTTATGMQITDKAHEGMSFGELRVWQSEQDEFMRALKTYIEEYNALKF